MGFSHHVVVDAHLFHYQRRFVEEVLSLFLGKNSLFDQDRHQRERCNVRAHTHADILVIQVDVTPRVLQRGETACLPVQGQNVRVPPYRHRWWHSGRLSNVQSARILPQRSRYATIRGETVPGTSRAKPEPRGSSMVSQVGFP
jgi:hypothetical protein